MERFMASGAAATDKGGQALDALSNALETAGAAYGAPVTAAGGRGDSRSMPARMAAVAGRAQPGPEVRGGPARRAAITAAVPSKVGPPGTTLATAGDLGTVTADVLQRLQANHDHSRALVATARWEYPPERQLDLSDSVGNSARLEAVCGLAADRYDRRSGALVATGGICLPVNVDYSIPTWATANRPLRDGLPAFEASRGGVRYVTPPDIGVPTLQGGTASGAGTATTIWTAANDANPASPTTKPVWTVACGTEQLVYVNAIPTRIKFGNMQSRFQPEMVSANTEVAIAVAAREAELELLTLMYSASKQVAPKQYLGATRDLLASVDLLAAQYRYSHRIAATMTMTAVFPEWAKGVIRADLARELAHDNAGGRDVLAVSDGEIADWFAARGINVVWTLDGLQAGTYGTGGTAITNQYFGLATAGAQPQWPGQTADGAFMLAWLLFAEGSFQFLDGGRLDFGVVRDSVLDATNDYETFVELFEGVAFRGLECFQVQSMILPTGASAAGSSGTRLSTMPKWSRYAASSTSSVSSCCSVRVPSWVWMSRRPLMDTRPSGVNLEHMVLRVKCDRGEVCCHQQVGTQSASDRSRVSIRY